MKQISILIVEDHNLLRETWKLIFNSDQRFSVMETVGTGEEGIKKALTLRPDVILMDINLPGISGIAATENLVKCWPDCKIIGVSLHNEPHYFKKLMNVGALGYVTKNSSSEELFTAIDEVQNGRKFICAEVKNIILNQSFNEDSKTNLLQLLSQREKEVAELIKQGISSKEISVILNISQKTIEVHRYNIYRKLKVRNATSLVQLLHDYSPN
ncbi:MAG TPA: response regulator transcription factor [Chitinophagaceae bacterium]|nr:response regulator transcription factor [Chitinophagaceae bacterium]